MKAIVIAHCIDGGSQFRHLDAHHGELEFTQYGYNFDRGEFPECLSEGYMSFMYNDDLDCLFVQTAYESTRRLTPEEEKIVIEYTQGQWSDGIGEHFEQQDFNDEFQNPSPWYRGQEAFIFYMK